MKLFITGSTGFIGSNLLKFYKNHDIKVYDYNSDINYQLNSFQPDCIINCAAEIYNKDKMWLSNVEFTKSCLDWIRLNQNTNMIQLGSSSEYGSYDRATTELDSVKALDMYGSTKAIATHLCRTYSITYDIDVVVVRPYSPYGPGERPHRLFPRLWQAFKLDKEMQLVQGVHDFCYIDDFINALDILVNSNKRDRGEIINVSSGIQTSNMEVLETFRNLTGKQGSVKVLDDFCTPKVWQANIDLIAEKYGWRPKTNLESGIKQFLEKASYYE